MSRLTPAFPVLLLALVLEGAACSQTFDAGSSRPRGILPVDARNPILLVNDGTIDNWQGEYAVLLANGGGPRLVGIVVNASTSWPNLEDNVAGWRELVSVATESGLRDIPDPIASVATPLVRPPSGEIDDTVGNRSEGARRIVEASLRFGLPYRPLVVVTGAGLTDVADAYLYDRSVVDRVVVVSSLGAVNDAGGGMGSPNGDQDPWADTIVAARFRYVQVSAFYDQLGDVPDDKLGQLPDNPLGARIAAKQPGLWHWPPASDQVSVLAVGLPSFATAVRRVASAGPVAAGATAGPDLAHNPNGPGLLVTDCKGDEPTKRLWELLLDPATFSP